MTFKSPMEALGGGKAILGFVGPHMTKISNFHKGPGCIVFFYLNSSTYHDDEI